MVKQYLKEKGDREEFEDLPVVGLNQLLSEFYMDARTVCWGLFL